MKSFLRLKFRLLLACLSMGTALGAALVSCGDGVSTNDNVLMVSIEPLRFLVEEIVGDDFEVSVLVPPGSSPETYEPTPLQIRAMEDAHLVFSTGLIGFERVMLDKFPSPERFVDLSAGIELIADKHGHGEHGHEHEHEQDEHAARHDTSHVHAHANGGADPHIWVSPRALAKMAATAYDRIHGLFPDSISYTANYVRMKERLTALDAEVAQRIAVSPTRSFMIFHPGLTYYARDYGLWQIALENDGKEPSARQLAETVALARAEKITKVLYQSEFPRRIVEVAAAEIGAEPVEIDILGYDIVGNILKITEIIAHPVDPASAADPAFTISTVSASETSDSL